MSDKKFQEAVFAYLKKHPKAKNPMDYLVGVGKERIVSALKKSKGREIVFTHIEGTYGGYKITYK